MIKDKIVLVEGDITESDVDAIVNAANTDLVLGSGVAGAIRKKGGPQIQADCEKLAPVELGSAVATRAGGMRARYVIHAAAMRLGNTVTHDSLKNATLNALKLAGEKRCKTVALPAIGTGVGGYKIDICARDMLHAAYDYLKFVPDTNLQEVRFVLYDRDGYDSFAAALEALPND